VTWRDGAVIPGEIREGPAAIRATLVGAGSSARDAAELLRARGVRRVFVIGNGTSLHSALAATALYRRYAGPDDAVALAMTAGEFRTYRPRLGTQDALIGISASGEFADVVTAFSELRGMVPTIGIVHVPGSSLTSVADRIVLSAGGPSRVPVMTKTFSATLVATELTLLALLAPAEAAPALDGLAAAADHAEAVIGEAEKGLAALVARIEPYDHVFVVGAGLAHIAALEAALKLKEIARVHAEGGETWEVTSGAATMIDERAVVIGLAPNGRGRAATADLMRHAAGWGAATVEIGPEASVEGSLLVRLPVAAEEDHAPLTVVPPVALAADALSRHRGLDPDRPDWVARYHSQGLHHIVGANVRATGVEEPA
jgi:glucosamine--fructose-6-phosphate aminotransferase (isomerizing)